ncbi:MAG TPA: transcription elongation factor GreA [Candidatus Mcinerneyibacterium sp.]|nr:transcription elongation factor GreA [Candidatus Mcinerneyibacterium sp.]
MKPIYISKEKYRELEEELKRLKSKERPKILEAIKEAKALGDLSENAEYKTAKDKQRFLEDRISELQEKLSRAQILNGDNFQTDKIVLGSKVTVKNLDTEDKEVFIIVSQEEADINENKISADSPIGSNLIGKKVGDKLLVRTPGGNKKYEVLKIEKGF